MRVTSNMKAGGLKVNHNQAAPKQCLRVKSNVKAGPTGSSVWGGSTHLNHSQSVRGLRVRSNVKAGGPGLVLQHNQTVVRRAR